MNHLAEMFIGEEVSGILFIRDYIELQCEEKRIHFFSNPVIVQESIRYSFPEKSSYSAFVDLVGKTIKAITLSDGIYTFMFDNGVAIEVQEAGGIGGETFNIIDLSKSGEGGLYVY